MKKLAIGVMSGTSGDGVSVAVAYFGERSFQLIDYKTFPYPKKISVKIREPFTLPISEISQFNFKLGEIFSESILKILRRNRISSEQVAVIGSHGQTIFHHPIGKIPSTLQIGESSVIAERTGITVVSDFRPRDIACGGEGAPLIPFFDNFFWGEGPPRAFLNIGGIANVTLVGKGIKKPIAFDTGPGNCLIDWCVQKITNGKVLMDKNGKIAAKGKVNLKIVQEMARHPYFKKKPPKSTGRELFNENFLPGEFLTILKNKPYDALTTITYFTAYTIAESYKRFVILLHPPFNTPSFGHPFSKGEFGERGGLKEVIVSGGGALNKTLMSYLQNLLQKIWNSSPSGTVPVCSIEKFGIHPQAKEPLAFAFFALQAIQGKTNHLPSSTGAIEARILGKITPGRNFRGIK